MAFSNPYPSVITADLAGWGVKEAVQKGIARGVFSNETGMGSAPMAHVTTDVAHPVQQGFYGIFEVFLDTNVSLAVRAKPNASIQCLHEIIQLLQRERIAYTVRQQITRKGA